VGREERVSGAGGGRIGICSRGVLFLDRAEKNTLPYRAWGGIGGIDKGGI